MADADYGSLKGPDVGSNRSASNGPEGGPGDDPTRSGFVETIRSGASFGIKKIQQTAEDLQDALDANPECPEWYFNGTITGLLVDVGSTGGYTLFLLLTMFFGLEANRGELLDCTIGTGDLEMRSFWTACFCEYTKAHLLIFPTLCLSVVSLYIGRDVAQKRLYYGLLVNGGVIDFHKNKVFLDPLPLILIANYLHVITHLCLMFWLINIRNEEDAKAHALGNMRSELLHHEPEFYRHEEEAKTPSWKSTAALGYLWGAVMIPGTLVIIFVVLGYNVETYLVPLSQYLQGVELSLPTPRSPSQRVESARTLSAESARDLSKLFVFRDACVKVALEDPNWNGRLRHSICGLELDRQYEAVVQAAVEVSSKTRVRKEHGAIRLLSAMWPTQLLLRWDTPGADARNFRLLWICLSLSGIAFMIFAVCSMLPGLAKDVHNAYENNHLAGCAQAPVLFMTFVVVVLCIITYVHTFRWLMTRAQNDDLDAFASRLEEQMEAMESAMESKVLGTFIEEPPRSDDKPPATGTAAAETGPVQGAVSAVPEVKAKKP